MPRTADMSGTDRNCKHHTFLALRELDRPVRQGDTRTISAKIRSLGDIAGGPEPDIGCTVAQRG